MGIIMEKLENEIIINIQNGLNKEDIVNAVYSESELKEKKGVFGEQRLGDEPHVSIRLLNKNRSESLEGCPYCTQVHINKEMNYGHNVTSKSTLKEMLTKSKAELNSLKGTETIEDYHGYEVYIDNDGQEHKVGYYNIDDVKGFKKDLNSSTFDGELRESRTIEQCRYGKVYFDEKDMQYKQTCEECEYTTIVNEENMVFPTLKEQLELERENLQKVRKLYPGLLKTYTQITDSQKR